MKVKVLHKFTDKYTGEQYRRGDVLDITAERYNEIMRVGLLVYKIEQDNAQSVSSESANTLSNDEAETLRNDSAPSGDGFDIMSMRELREYANAAHKLTFKVGTKKAEIIETLRRMERNGR